MCALSKITISTHHVSCLGMFPDIVRVRDHRQCGNPQVGILGIDDEVPHTLKSYNLIKTPKTRFFFSFHPNTRVLNLLMGC